VLTRTLTAFAISFWLCPLTSSSSAAQTDSKKSAPGATFRSSVDVVSVAAVVRDQRGRFVRNLTRGDFQIIENGRQRQILDFVADDDTGPLSLALLFDVSGSMGVGSKLEAAKHAADHVIGWLRPQQDQAALFAFDTRLVEIQPFTSDVGRLHDALDRLKPFGATSLYDAISATAKKVAPHTQRRRAVLVLTDGVDTSSRLKAAEVSAAASGIDVPVYVFAVVSPLSDPNSELSLDTQTPAGEGSELGNLAEWTGGRLFVLSASAHAPLTAGELLRELRHQYLIAFEPGPGSGWQRLEIRTRKKNLVVRARSGYVAGGPQSFFDNFNRGSAPDPGSVARGAPAPRSAPSRAARYAALAKSSKGSDNKEAVSHA